MSGVDRERYEQFRERYAGDTRYARKFIVGGDRDAIERSLRSLLPLSPLPEIELADPLGAVRDQLLKTDLDPVIEEAIASFTRTSEVRVK
jgi:hypothetical protein